MCVVYMSCDVTVVYLICVHAFMVCVCTCKMCSMHMCMMCVLWVGGICDYVLCTCVMYIGV